HAADHRALGARDRDDGLLHRERPHLPLPPAAAGRPREAGDAGADRGLLQRDHDLGLRRPPDHAAGHQLPDLRVHHPGVRPRDAALDPAAPAHGAGALPDRCRVRLVHRRPARDPLPDELQLGSHQLHPARKRLHPLRDADAPGDGARVPAPRRDDDAGPRRHRHLELHAAALAGVDRGPRRAHSPAPGNGPRHDDGRVHPGARAVRAELLPGARGRAEAAVRGRARAVVIIAADWVVPVDGPPIRNGAVRVEGRAIAEVGPAGDAADERFDGAVILPGLVNAHTHLEYAAMGGFGDGMAFGPWIEDHIRRKAATGAGDSLEQARAGAAACLRTGVTTIADCSYSGAVADAAAEAGLRAIVYLEGFSDWPDLRARTEARLDAATTTELVQPGVSPHAPFTVTLDDYRMLVGLARERGLPIATHLLESARETMHLEEFGDILGPDTVAIHVVYAD